MALPTYSSKRSKTCACSSGRLSNLHAEGSHPTEGSWNQAASEEFLFK